MEETITISLTKEQARQLRRELNSLYGYHLNDDRVHIDNCGSKVYEEIFSQIPTNFLDK